jgi:hypothetical protein
MLNELNVLLSFAQFDADRCWDLGRSTGPVRGQCERSSRKTRRGGADPASPPEWALPHALRNHRRSPRRWSRSAAAPRADPRGRGRRLHIWHIRRLIDALDSQRLPGHFARETIIKVDVPCARMCPSRAVTRASVEMIRRVCDTTWASALMRPMSLVIGRDRLTLPGVPLCCI